MKTSWRDLSRFRLKCSVSIIFSTMVLSPALHPSLFLTTSSNPCLLLDPVSQLGDARVDTGLVPTSAALTPAYDAGLEPHSTLLETHQGASGVSLVSTVSGERLLDWLWMWEHDNYMGVKPICISPLSWCRSVSPGMRRLLRPRIRCRASWRWLGPRWPRYTPCRWWFSPMPSAAAAPLNLQEQDKGVTWPLCSSLTSKVVMGWISVS